MKFATFLYDNTYIESVEAFCNTIDVVDVEWHDDYLIVMYN